MLDPSARHGRPGHILLAEDNPLNQRVATVMLENLGFHADVVADGEEAVKAASLTPYRAILMDCQIPVLDGYQATDAIRHLQGESSRTPNHRDHCLGHTFRPATLLGCRHGRLPHEAAQPQGVGRRIGPLGTEPIRPG